MYFYWPYRGKADEFRNFVKDLFKAALVPLIAAVVVALLILDSCRGLTDRDHYKQH